MENNQFTEQPPEKSKIGWMALIGLVVAVGSLVVAFLAYRSDLFAASGQEQSFATDEAIQSEQLRAETTLVAVQDEQLIVLQQILTLQSEAVESDSKPEQTALAEEVKSLASTQAVLQATINYIDASNDSTKSTITPIKVASVSPTPSPIENAETSENQNSTIESNSEVISSTFKNKNIDGWSAYRAGFINPGSGGSGGGKDNGCLIVNEDKSDTGYFVAPKKFYGNWEKYSYLKFDLWSSGGTYFTSGNGMYGDVYLANEFATATLMLPNRPSNQWETFIIPLDRDDNWLFGGGASTLSDILVNVTDFQIRGEYGKGTDQTGLDNVILE